MEVEGKSLVAVSLAFTPPFPRSSLGSDVRGSSSREKGWGSEKDHLYHVGNQRPVF